MFSFLCLSFMKWNKIRLMFSLSRFKTYVNITTSTDCYLVPGSIAYNEFQEDDLMEFSDVSLHIYPEVKELSEDEIDRQCKSLVRLVSHPFTLKGLCRQCLRQSLCEPSPTVVRTLPIPRALKQYILCHDL